MTALYHQHHIGPQPCAVAMIHDDGTVSLARATGGHVFIRCPLRDVPRIGCATIIPEPPVPPAPPDLDPPEGE